MSGQLQANPASNKGRFSHPDHATSKVLMPIAEMRVVRAPTCGVCAQARHNSLSVPHIPEMDLKERKLKHIVNRERRTSKHSS